MGGIERSSNGGRISALPRQSEPQSVSRSLARELSRHRGAGALCRAAARSRLEPGQIEPARGLPEVPPGNRRRPDLGQLRQHHPAVGRGLAGLAPPVLLDRERNLGGVAGLPLGGRLKGHGGPRRHLAGRRRGGRAVPGRRCLRASGPCAAIPFLTAANSIRELWGARVNEFLKLLPTAAKRGRELGMSRGGLHAEVEITGDLREFPPVIQRMSRCPATRRSSWSMRRSAPMLPSRPPNSSPPPSPAARRCSARPCIRWSTPATRACSCTACIEPTGHPTGSIPSAMAGRSISGLSSWPC